MQIVRPFRVDAGARHVEILDQTRLPGEEVWIELRDPEQVIEAIRSLRVRGAPAIGVAGAYAMWLADDSRAWAPRIAAARPTAVNLSWAVDRMLSCVERGGDLFLEADAIREEDEASCRAIGRYGAELLGSRSTVLTHCNAGSLATAGYGTALGVVYAAAEAGKSIAVFADETRPLLQGARLTAWELDRAGIDVTVVADSVAASLLASGRVDAVVVGADRIARNGDVANKIGTYAVALAAKAHSVPFYVAAPRSTFDLDCPNGAAIPIEERAAGEVTEGFGTRTAPEGIAVFSPAFDVTPAALVTALVTDVGVFPPTEAEIASRVGIS